LALLLVMVGMTVAASRPDSSHLFQLVVNLDWVGLITHWVPNEVSALSTSLPPHPDFAWRNEIPSA